MMAIFVSAVLVVCELVSLSRTALIHPRYNMMAVTSVDTGDKQKEDKDTEQNLKADDHIDYYMEHGEYFEGDLKISEDLIDAYYGRSPSAQSLTTSGLWPSGKYYYFCDPTVDNITKNLITEAIQIWGRALNSCITFTEEKSDKGYVKFTTSRSGCYSTAIGYRGALEHVINLANPVCTNLHTVLHEIGHTLGYWHEQSRPDRDQYIRINYANVARVFRSQLSKQSVWATSTNDMGYDYGSIMHYSQTAFSRNTGNTIDIVNMAEYIRQGSPVLGGGTTLSATDISAIKRHYNCQ